MSEEGLQIAETETRKETVIADATIVTVEGIAIAIVEHLDGIGAAVAVVNVVEDGHQGPSRDQDLFRETEDRGQGLLVAEETTDETTAAMTAATRLGIDVTMTSLTADQEAEDEGTEGTVVARTTMQLRTARMAMTRGREKVLTIRQISETTIAALRKEAWVETIAHIQTATIVPSLGTKAKSGSSTLKIQSNRTASKQSKNE